MNDRIGGLNTIAKGGWGALQETAFIDGLAHPWRGVVGRLAGKDAALALLNGYITGALSRTVWGDINRATVLEYAKRKLSEVEAK